MRIHAAVKPILTKPRGRRLHSLDVAVGLYIGYVSRHHQGSLQSIASSLPSFVAFLRRARVRDIRRVTPAHIDAYMRQLATMKTHWRGTPFAETTRVSYATNLRRLFCYLFTQNLILINPAADLFMPRVKALPRVVPTETQARRIMHAPSPWTLVGRRDRAILETFYGSGIRAKECRDLDLRDIDLSRLILTVRQGKGGKGRVVPLSGRAGVALDVYLREVRPELMKRPREQALFLSFLTGGRMKQFAMDQVVAKAARTAGVPVRMAPHALRHACALHLLKGGADIRHVQAILGHSRIATTAIYTRLDMTDLKRVVERSHPRENSCERRRRPRPVWADSKIGVRWRLRRSPSKTRTS